MEKRLDRVEHVWSAENDRWMLIRRYSDASVGLNYMQGDEYEEFLEYCNVADEGLSEFYMQMKQTFLIQRQSVNELNFINDVMWTYHNAISCHEDNTYVPPKKKCKCK
jgi:hypothetical protein